MNDEKVPESGQITRRRALQTVGVGGAIAVAGCLHDDEPCNLTISKEHSGESVTYGGTTEFEITVCNEGDEECPDAVTVTDDLPAGTTFDSVSGSGWTANESGGVVTCEHPNTGGLGGGDCLPTLTLTIAVGQPSEVGPEIANCAAIGQGSISVGQAERSRQKRDCVKVPVELEGECDLAISKRYPGDVVTEGSAATFQIEVCNEGDGVCADSVTVVDSLPAGVTFGSASGTGWSASQSGGSVIATHDNTAGLDPGECLPVLELTLNIGSISETGDVIRNCVGIRISDANATNNRDCVRVPVVSEEGECVLSLEKDVDGEFQFGQQGTYTFTVCNDGDDDCTTPIVIEDFLPTGITFDSVSGDWDASVSGNSVTLENDTYGPLEPGDCLEFEMVVNVGSASQVTSDVVRNCAVLTYDDKRDSDCIEHPITEGGEPEDCLLSLEKDVDGEFQFGGQGTYVLTVCNEGNEDCSTPLRINDTLPTGITFDSVTGNWDASVSGSAVTLENDTYGPLAPGDCLEIEMIVNVGDGSQITSDVVRNCAVLIYDGKRVRSCVEHPITQDDDPEEPSECDIDYNFNSGYDIVAGTTFSDGDTDNSWFIHQDTTGSGNIPRTASIVDMSVVNARWGNQFTNTRWISHKSDAQVPSAGQTVVYRYTWCLHEDFHDPDLSLRVHAEDAVADIRLNGTSLMFSGNGQYQGAPIDETYTDPQLFQIGANTLEIEVVEDTTGEACAVNIEGSIKAKQANCECGNH